MFSTGYQPVKRRLSACYARVGVVLHLVVCVVGPAGVGGNVLLRLSLGRKWLCPEQCWVGFAFGIGGSVPYSITNSPPPHACVIDLEGSEKSVPVMGTVLRRSLIIHNAVSLFTESLSPNWEHKGDSKFHISRQIK